MIIDENWVLLGAMALIALVLMLRSYLAANSRDNQMQLEHRQRLDLAREETMRMELLATACGLGPQRRAITRRRYFPDPPPPKHNPERPTP